jgi:hypothetical protein
MEPTYVGCYEIPVFAKVSNKIKIIKDLYTFAQGFLAQ